MQRCESNPGRMTKTMLEIERWYRSVDQARVLAGRKLAYLCASRCIMKVCESLHARFICGSVQSRPKNWSDSSCNVRLNNESIKYSTLFERCWNQPVSLLRSNSRRPSQVQPMSVPRKRPSSRQNINIFEGGLCCVLCEARSGNHTSPAPLLNP